MLQGNGGDLQIVWTDNRAGPFELTADPSASAATVIIERKRGERGKKLIEFGMFTNWI